LKKEITKIEDEMNRLGIPMPTRPPKSINTPANTEVMRDELMFRTIYTGVQNFLNEHQRTLLMMANKRMRKIFLNMMQTEIGIYTALVDYGTIKGWLQIPPEYKGKS
jgi:hypothetical protein